MDNQQEGKETKETVAGGGRIPGTRNVISAFRGLCPLNTLQLLKRGCLDLLKRLHVNAFIHMFNEPQRHHT